MRHLLGAACALILATPAVAWDGFDQGSGTSVEIGKGNLVRSGRSIEVYDQSTGQYHDVEVQSIDGRGSSVRVQVYDRKLGEYRTLEMDD